MSEKNIVIPKEEHFAAWWNYGSLYALYRIKSECRFL
jgi:hypothetical protein